MMRRSHFLTAGLGAGAAAALGTGADAQTFSLTAPPHLRGPHRSASSGSLGLAYEFLDQMMDLYGTGSTTRLVQSYVPTSAQNLGDLAYTYDNAAVIIALLQRGTSDDLSRAQVLGNSLIFAQAYDPINDGRVRDGYHVNPFVLKNGTPNIAFDDNEGGSHTETLAWAGIALAQLYVITQQHTYLSAALALGQWIERHAHDRRGPGGYVDGFAQGNKRIFSKATRANISVYAFFTMLSALASRVPWQERAQHALTFVEGMWSGSGKYFWVGTLSDGVTINTSHISEDVQSWSYLATRNATFEASIDWAYANLRVNAAPFVGVGYSNYDLSGIWFEGTAHMSAAFLARNSSGDAKKAVTFLSSIQLAQTQAPNNDGMGIDAASEDGLRTGDGTKYYAALHIGATSWYCLAAQAANPFVLL